MKKKFSELQKTQKKIIYFPVLIELKNGSTLNGKLLKMDPYMNISLESVIITQKNGFFFSELHFIYLKGENVKYLRFF